MLERHPTQQKWADEVITMLREAAAAVTEATTEQRGQHDSPPLAAVEVDQTTQQRLGLHTTYRLR